MPLVLIGLTGGIACGKSTVSKLLAEEHHIHVIDADQIVHELQQPHAPCVQKIAQRWPDCVDAATGALKREELGRIVFADPTARKLLARIMNGPIFWTVMQRILEQWWTHLTSRRPVVVVLDAPTLFETKLFTYFISSSVVVACSEERQVERLAKRNGMSREAALDRIHSQMPLEKKRALAGYVIENDGENDFPALKASVEGAVGWMKQQSAHKITWLVAGASVGVLGITAMMGALLRSLLA